VVMEFDWPKIGEPRLPVGVPRFTLLKIFRAVDTKGKGIAQCSCLPDRTYRPTPTPLARATESATVAPTSPWPATLSAGGNSSFFPRPNVLLRRRFAVNWPGPSP